MVKDKGASSDPINRLVMSSPSTYLIVLTVFFKLLLLQTSSQPYFILKVLKRGSYKWVAEGQLRWDCNTWNHLLCKQINSIKNKVSYKL